MIAMLSILSISWCTKTYTTQISFDEYSMTLKTSSTGYHEIHFSPAQLGNTNQNIYKSFVPGDQTGFVHSILIRKDKDNWLTLEKLVTLNMEKNKRKLPWFIDEGQSAMSFTCGEEEIQWYKASFTIDAINPKEIIYLNQYFFTRNWLLYIISTSTQESDKNKQLNKAINSIQCQK
jgi:hypothetical protein